VALDDRVEAAGERRDVERAGQAHRRRHRVEWVARLQLVEQPHALLRERERGLPWIGAARNLRDT
jgi:hypothetical protein